jgi:hypothetical protein
MFLWCIINRMTARTNATVTTIVKQIGKLREAMIEKNSDVTAFTTYVKQLMHLYTSNRRTEPDADSLLANLFEAYAVCNDTGFVTWIKRKEEDHYENTIILTPGTLMDMASKKYQTQVQKGSWGGEPPERKDMMSLSARVDTIQLQLDKSHARWMTDNEHRKKWYANAPPWMKNPPESLNERTKRVGDNEYIWCPFHKMWQMHSPSECILNLANRDGERSSIYKPRSYTRSKYDIIKKIVWHHTIFSGKTYDVIHIMYDRHTMVVCCHTKFCMMIIQL